MGGRGAVADLFFPSSSEGEGEVGRELARELDSELDRDVDRWLPLELSEDTKDDGQVE